MATAAAATTAACTAPSVGAVTAENGGGARACGCKVCCFGGGCGGRGLVVEDVERAMHEGLRAGVVHAVQDCSVVLRQLV